MSKKFEKIMYDKLYEYIENCLSQLLCGFRTALSPIPTFTKTSKELDSGGFIGTILTDFSKAYDCLPHDLYNTQKKICGGVWFQYSCEWYIEQIKLLKMPNFQRVSNNLQEIYEVSVLEVCRV